MTRVGRRLRVRQEIAAIRDPNCKHCPLSQTTTGHVCVMGRGNPVAPIVVVGEAPGQAEEKYGEPFRGKSGQYMDEILEELKMSHMVWITNVVRCRPPKNRYPKPFEIETCTYNYFEPEVSLVNPKIIVLAAKAAIVYFWGKHPTLLVGFERFVIKHPEERERTKWWPCPTIFGWHPSYVLRMGCNEKSVAEFKSQFTIAKEYVEALQ